ncbi:MAG TPA: O-antigen ligase family protein [Gaiellaceae bacterium]|nr:O-antigen ligase family protein [Gaiellaceae bacterium]
MRWAGARRTEILFLACAFAITWEKIHWSFGGNIALEDILAGLFVVLFALDRLAAGDRRVQRTAAVVLLFFAAFLLVYLVGFFNLDTKQSLDQFAKGMVKFVLHFGLLVCGVAYLARRATGFYWRTLGVFTAGLAVNAGYGVLQLLTARAGHNLDRIVLGPLTGGASSINIYGAVNGASVYRPNALTGDPNHLGIMLLVPLLALTPVYLRLERGPRLRLPLVLLLGFLLLVELATLSRSGLLGLAVGLVVLALPYRRLFVSRAVLVPLGAVGLVVAAVVARRAHFFETVLRSRVQTGGRSTSAHFGVYDFIPQILHSHPLFGLGLNNFSVYYEFVTGKTNWGPHSFYVALIVETGLVGTLVFALFLRYLFVRLRAARRLGRALALARDPAAARLRPLAWGLTATLAGTMAANAFYLTMQFYYFYFVAILVLALPVVFARAERARLT